MVTPTAYVRWLSTRRSSSGTSRCCSARWRSRNAATTARPPTTRAGRRDRRAVLGADPAQAVDERAEAERGEHDARDVEGALAGLAHVGQPAHRDPGDDGGDRQDQAEQPAPRGELEHHAGDGRAERGGDRDREHHVAHDPAAVALGDDRHQRRHQQRQHHRGAGGLHDPADDEHPEDGRQRGEQGAGEEDGHRGQERLPRGDALQEPAGHRDDHGHRQHEGGREPLRAAGGDVELDHQPRDRVDHDRLVEDHHEGGEHQPAQDGVRRLDRARRLVGVGVCSGTRRSSVSGWRVVLMPVSTGAVGRTHRTTRGFPAATDFPGDGWWIPAPRPPRPGEDGNGRVLGVWRKGRFGGCGQARPGGGRRVSGAVGDGSCPSSLASASREPRPRRRRSCRAW